MAKYDVYRDPRGTENLLLNVQSDIFDRLDTRLAIPLLPEHPQRAALKRLNPIFAVGDRRYVAFTQLMLAVPARALKDPLANVADRRDEITAALDFLYQGF